MAEMPPSIGAENLRCPRAEPCSSAPAGRARSRPLRPSPQPRLLARKCARAPARWRLRRSRCGLSAVCPACCSSSPSATFCRAMVSSRPGAAPGELVARGPQDPREAGDRRPGLAALRAEAAQPARKARCSLAEPESTWLFPFHEPYLPCAAPTC